MLRRLIGPLCFLVLVHLPPTATPAEEEISISSGQQWFAENKDALLALHQLVLDQPAIKRIDPGMTLKFVPKYEDFDSDTEATYRRLEEICNEMGIVSVAVAGRGSGSNGELISVTYTIATRGIYVSGSALSIKYILSDAILEHLTEPGYEVKPLELENWYVVVSIS